MNSNDLFFHSLQAISAIDGRHRPMTQPLAQWFSEFALHKYRLYMQIEYLIALSELEAFSALRNFTPDEKALLRNLCTNFSLQDAKVIQDIDRFGYNGIKPLNHDLKAVEYFLKMKMKQTTLQDVVEFVHFGCTSEDANNIAYALMLDGALQQIYLPSLRDLLERLATHAKTYKTTAMLSKTHGQPATPTTFGKEIANYLSRLQKVLSDLHATKLPAKLNGAVGNFNAHYFAAPEVNWIEFSEHFISQLGFEANLHTTQIEPHDGLTKVCGLLISINNILRDLATDLWLYISEGFLVQQRIESEVGSSTMPHKINPWRVEVAEGSSVEANAKLVGLIQKWQVSRLQRDLSDHESQRGIGVALAHSYLTVLHLIQELDRLQVSEEKMRASLSDRGSILTEAVQTLLRKTGNEEPYERLKSFARGRHCSLSQLHEFIAQLSLDQEHKKQLLALTPHTYLGLAPELVQMAVSDFEKWKAKLTKENQPKGQVVAVSGGQWGDEGKGKIVDLMAANFDVTARATGGNNAGHTVVVAGHKRVFHLLPSAITHAHVECILGDGMVIDPLVLLEEMQQLEQEKYSLDNLYISSNAHVILPYHKMLDLWQEEFKSANKVGTTGRGIGPTYTDKMQRVGIRINDLYDKELLKGKIKIQLQEKIHLFTTLYTKNESQILKALHNILTQSAHCKEHLNMIHSPDTVESIPEFLCELYFLLGQKFIQHVTLTSHKLHQALHAGKRILLEGAQGLLLDVDHGTYPYVTSSNPSVGGFLTGLGIDKIDDTYSVIKAYTTRIGSGPFPSEAPEDIATFLQQKGAEFGATTGRPRRCGWHDALLSRYTAQINGPKVIITKLDVLGGLETLKICNSYKYTGPARYYNGVEYKPGSVVTHFIPDTQFLSHCIPYGWIEVPGWQEDLSTIRSFEQLPDAAKEYLKTIEELSAVTVCMVSVGPDRTQTLMVPGKWPFQSNQQPLQKSSQPVHSTLKYDAIIYDLDNTLVATNKFVFDLITKTARQVNQEIAIDIPSDERIRQVQKQNMGFEEIFSTLFENPVGYNGQKPIWQIILEKYREVAPSMHYCENEGGVATVQQFAAQGVIQGVVTNRIRMASDRLHQANYPGFSFVLQPKSKEDRKPNPRCLLSAFEFLETKNIPKEKIVSVGDHLDDFNAARAAGIDFVGITTGSITKEEFIAAGLDPKYVIEELSELQRILKE